MSVKVLQDSFEAWINVMPGSQHKLIVTGMVEAPTADWQVSLKRTVPQGINPKILLLDLIAVAPKDRAAEVVTPIEVRYEEPAEKGQFTDVTIHFGSDSFSKPVGTAS